MAGEHELIARIRGFLNSGLQQVTPEARELAQQYAALCAQTNDRLRKCEMYLNEGLRSEAIHLAEIAPPVLELTATLEFHGVELWREFCMQNNLPVAPLIPVDVVERLNDAYMAVNALDPLLNEYRRLIHTGTLTEKIDILRRICSLDPDNQNWRTDLVQFERARHDELGDEVKAVVSGQDTRRMKALLHELQSTSWMRNPNPTLAGALMRRLDEIRTQGAQARADEIAKHIWEAYSALDLYATEAALKTWQALLSRERIQPPAELVSQVSDANEWVNEQRRKEADERAFRQGCDALLAGLEQRLPKDELERRIYEVNRFEREVPEALQDRVARALQDADLAARRSFRIKLIAIGIFVIALAVPVFMFVRFTVRSRAHADQIEALGVALDNANIEGAEAILNQIRNADPDFHRSVAAQKGIARLEKLKSEIVECDRILKQLDDIRNQCFPTQIDPSDLEERWVELAKQVTKIERQWLALEKQAKAFARTQEQKTKLLDWQAARDNYVAALGRIARAEFTRHLGRAVALCQELGRRDAKEDPDSYEKKFQQLGQALKDARSVPLITDQERARLDLLSDRASEFTAQLNAAKEWLKALAQLEADIKQALPNINAYEQLLKDFVARFPTHKEAASLKRSLADVALAKDLASDERWVPPHTDQRKTEIERFLLSRDSQQSVWRDLLQPLLRQLEAAQHIAEARTELARMKYIDLLSKLYTFLDKKSSPPTRYYYLGDVERKQKGKLSGKAVYEYTIHRCYGKRHRLEDKPLTRVETDVTILTNPEDNLATHCKFLRQFFNELDKVAPGDTEAFLLKQAEAIRRHKDIDPVIKVTIIGYVLRAAEKVTAGNADMIAAAQRRMRILNTNIFWMEPCPVGALSQPKQDIAAVLSTLSEMPSMAILSTVRNEIQEAALTRKLQCVGGVVKDGDDVRLNLHGANVAEVWIITRGTDGRPTVYIAAKKNAQGGVDILPKVKQYLYPGLPLLAPMDGRRTADIVAGIIKDLPPDQAANIIKSIAWPSCWPKNGRTGKPPGE